MRGPRFDATINLGHVLTFIGFILAGAGAYYGVRIDLTAIGIRLGVVETQISKITELLITQSRQEERINQFERRLEKVERSPPQASAFPSR